MTIPVVSGKISAGSIQELMTNLKGRFPQVKIKTSTAAISEEDLDRLVVQARKDSALQGAGIVDVNRNDSNSGLVADVDLSEKLTAARQLAEARYGNKLSIRIRKNSLVSRQHDRTPYFAGIPIYKSPVSAMECTSGPRVNKAGYGKYMLTAAHCSQYSTGATWYHPAAPSNTQVSIGYVSAVNTAVDAELVTGSYYPGIWSGGTSNAYSLAIDRRVVSEGVGTVVCADGAQTGQICRDKITHLDYLLYGVHTVRACNTDGVWPVDHGDSGGNIYHVDSTGLLYYHGMIDGRDNTAPCVLYVPMYRLESGLGITLDLTP